MTEVGIDTLVLIGLLDPKDVWHDRAIALKEALQAHEAEIAVFDCVLAEAISAMSRRIHEQRRTVELDHLLDSVLAGYPEEDVLWVLPDVPRLYRDLVELGVPAKGNSTSTTR